MRAKWMLYPLYYGEFTSFERSLFVFHRGFGEKMRAPCTGWLLCRDGYRIVVDVGPYEPEPAERNHGYPMEGTGAAAVRAALEAHSVSPEDVTDVILTHLHWDHTSNLGLFANARVHAQRAELTYASNPLPWHRVAYDVDLSPAWRSAIDRMQLANGDVELFDGITCHLLPGHTPGSQGVVVETEGGRHMIAGDNIDLDENWAGDDTWKHRPGGIFVDLATYMASLERMEGLAEVILPAHDFSVFEQKVYPG